MSTVPPRRGFARYDHRAISNLALTLANALGRYGIGCVAVAPSMAVTERQLEAHRSAAEQLRVPFETYCSAA